MAHSLRNISDRQEVTSRVVVDAGSRSAYHVRRSTPPNHGKLASKGTINMERPTELQEDQSQQWIADLRAVANAQDRAAFARLFKQFAPRLKSYLLSLKSDHTTNEMAEELVQETMIKVWTKAPFFNPEKAAVSTWIYTIARNCRIDYLRKANRVDSYLNAEDIWPVDEEPEPYVFLEQDKNKQTINEALSKLSKEQSDVIRQIYMEGKSHSEIAEVSRLPLGTVKSRARLAMKHLNLMLNT